MTIIAHAERIIAALPPARVQLLRTDPREGLAAAGLAVREVPELSAGTCEGGWCDGLTFHDNKTVLFAPTPDSRRESFTLLHEYAHVLLEEDDDAID